MILEMFPLVNSYPDYKWGLMPYVRKHKGASTSQIGGGLGKCFFPKQIGYLRDIGVLHGGKFFLIF